MRNLLKNRWALSAVVTTLIILVISVLLAIVVCYFAINVTNTRAQQENLSLNNQHVWYDGSGKVSQAALMIINTGGRDVVIQKLTVRGQTEPWDSIFYLVGTFTLTGDLAYISSVSAGSATTVSDGSGGYQDLSAATNDLTIKSGCSAIVYISNPDSISISDVGTTVPITVFTSQTMYYKEANVQGCSSSSQSLTVSNTHAWYDSSGSISQVAMVLTNNGAGFITIDDILVGNSGSGSNLYSCEGSFTVGSSLTYIPSLTDGYTLGSYTLSLSDISGLPMIDPGSTMILYIQNPAGVGASNIGQSVQIDISLQGQGVVTESVAVQASP